MRQLEERVPSVSNFRCPGDVIKYTRIKLGLSQKYVAFQADMSPSALCKIEGGKRMNPRNVVQISDALKISPHELIGFDKKQPSITESVEKMKQMFPHIWKDIVKESIKDLN